jgi:CheY-like chemotaxis protein
LSAADPTAAAGQLAAAPFDAVLVDPATLARLLADRSRDELVLSAIQNGIALLTLDGTITWAHPVFRSWCRTEPVGRPLLEALGHPTIASDHPDPIAVAAGGEAVTFRASCPTNPDRPFLDVTLRPVAGPDGAVRELVAMARNVSQEVEQQRKLDALHEAGEELSGLDADQLAYMNDPTRVELLKQNLKHCIHDLLHYDIIEVRLLDRQTGELKPLLQEGMAPEAASRKLYAQKSGNGVTGFVAATGTSYLCPDASRDPLYLQGATGARSSMTVPLKYHDEVVGTLNVESPRLNGFGPSDLQFTELFSKEIAAALHTLDLLHAQQSCTTAQSIDAINREIVIPVDEVLCSASVLLDKLGDDPAAAAHLRRILGAARAVKDNVQKVGRDLTGEGELVATGATPLAGKKVLVVDQDERVRRAAHLQLSRLGAEVETAGTATEGAAILTDAPFDTVLMEIKPPDMGGYAAYCRLRAARPSAVVAMTAAFGYDDGHAIVKARADGMKYVLFKPFRQDQLVKTVLDSAAVPVAGASGLSV